MSSAFPPDGWEPSTGYTWGVEIDREEAAAVLPKTGPYSIKFQTTAEGAILGDVKYIEPDRPYRLDLVARSSRASVGDTFDAYAFWLDVDGAVVTLSTPHSGVISPINTWVHTTYYLSVTGSTIRAVQLGLKKNNAQNINFWVDRFTIQRAPFAFSASNDASQASVGPSAEKLLFPDEDYDHGSWFSSSTATVKEAGLYHFDACADIDNLPSNTYGNIQLWKNGAVYRHGERIINGTGSAINTIMTGSWDVVAAVGDTFEIYCSHSNGSALSTVNAVPDAIWFSGHQLPPFGFG